MGYLLADIYGFFLAFIIYFFVILPFFIYAYYHFHKRIDTSLIGYFYINFFTAIMLSGYFNFNIKAGDWAQLYESVNFLFFAKLIFLFVNIFLAKKDLVSIKHFFSLHSLKILIIFSMSIIPLAFQDREELINFLYFNFNIF